MALSPNYGWSEPDNSSLVKNGAADIRTLGDAIDTSLWNVGFGQAGKNKIINGNFGIWQRGTSFTSPSSSYTADRFVANGQTSDVVSQQTFTAGTAPVSGYEGTYYARWATSATAGTRYFFQKVEDVRTLANQTASFSFWARVNSGTATLTAYFYQQFGSGGSADVQSTPSNFTATTSWQRFTYTTTMPSVSGKTIGTGSLVQAAVSFTATSNNVEFWGWQLEAGSKATPFQTATGTIQGELAACQRYYWRFGGSEANERFGTGQFSSTQTCNVIVQNPVPMRVNPTSIDFSTLAVFDGTTSIAATNATIASSTKFCPIVQISIASGGTANRSAQLLTNNSTSGYLGLSAEL